LALVPTSAIRTVSYCSTTADNRSDVSLISVSIAALVRGFVPGAAATGDADSSMASSSPIVTIRARGRNLDNGT
jgi:hypothetical protein